MSPTTKVRDLKIVQAWEQFVSSIIAVREAW